MSVDMNQEGAPNYFPNSFSGPGHDAKGEQHVAKVGRWMFPLPLTTHEEEGGREDPDGTFKLTSVTQIQL